MVGCSEWATGVKSCYILIGAQKNMTSSVSQLSPAHCNLVRRARKNKTSENSKKCAETKVLCVYVAHEADCKKVFHCFLKVSENFKPTPNKNFTHVKSKLIKQSGSKFFKGLCQPLFLHILVHFSALSFY